MSQIISTETILEDLKKIEEKYIEIDARIQAGNLFGAGFARQPLLEQIGALQAKLGGVAGDLETDDTQLLLSFFAYLQRGNVINMLRHATQVDIERVVEDFKLNRQYLRK